MQIIKAKPTLYNGIQMRSLLETRWAKFLDYCNIKWSYEPEGYVFKDGTAYLPDFYLPEQKAYLEVKGIMRESDMHKIECLTNESHLPVIIGYENGEFQIFERHLYESEKPVLFFSEESAIFQCSECKKYWFANTCGCWKCKCCGIYEGDHYIEKMYLGCENKIWGEVF